MHFKMIHKTSDIFVLDKTIIEKELGLSQK